MTKEQEKKMNRLLALGQEWARNQMFKETCRNSWDPEFFAYCEQKIAELKQVDMIERKHEDRDRIKFLDISEIDVEAWKNDTSPKDWRIAQKAN